MTGLVLMALAACTDEGVAVRSEPGWLGAPFPSDDHLVNGLPDLSAFPAVEGVALGPVVDSWVSQVESTCHGFGANTPIAFPLAGPVDLPSRTRGHPDDPVLLVDLARGTLLPLEVRVLDDAAGDPWLTDHLVQILPAPGHAPRSGATLAAVLMADAGVAREDVPDRVHDALDRAGVRGRPAAATVFTVQDTAGQLASLLDDLDRRIDARGWPDPVLRRATALTYETAETPGGRTATLATLTLEDGGTDTAWLDGTSDAQHIDLTAWPLDVWLVELPILNYSGLADRPYMSPGIAHLTDTDRTDGRIAFDGARVVTAPDTEWVRIVVQTPRGPGPHPFVVYDHGTGGTRFQAIQRRHAVDASLAPVMAEAGVAVVSHDQPLYGSRYDLLDNGFTDGWLGFYNVVNLAAMRDNHRQAAIEGYQVRRFAAEALPHLLDGDRAARMGHSLGATTANLGVAARPDVWRATFASGGAGILALSFLETGLVGTDSALIEDLGAVFGVTVDDETGVDVVIATALGLSDPAAQQHFDRFHPVVGLFQWIMDAADPVAVAGANDAPTTLLMGVGDWQVPNAGTEALHTALPDSTLVRCEVAGDYDPHACLWRDPKGMEALRAWLAEAL